jgi:peptide-methionine (S)-S-oxide reductase
LGDHTETFQIDYDPALISYEEILELFWDNHNPAAASWSRQYMSAIFYHSEEQKKAALESMAAVEEKLQVKINTEIMPLSRFYLAENYHQKYYLQSVQALAGEIKAYYPEFTAFVDSTAAARLNGLVAGYSDPALTAEELDSYGLSPRGRELLQRYLD